MQKLRTKQNNESAALQLKVNSMFNEFKKRRAVDFDKLVQRYKNKHNDLDNNQTTEMNEFKNRILKSSIKKSGSVSSKLIFNKFLYRE
jgi:hypothetical protein